MTIDMLSDKQRKILDFQKRKKIYEMISKYAGCHFRELERKSLLPTGTLRHHLNYLLKHEVIKERKLGSNVLYYPKNVDISNHKLLALLRQKNMRRIILFLLVHKKCTQKDLGNVLHFAPSTISWYIQRLMKENVIKPSKESKPVIYSLVLDENEIMHVLITYRESFLDSLVDKVIDMWEFN